MFEISKILEVERKCIEMMNGSNTFDEVSSQILEVICKSFSSSWGTYWKVDSTLLVLKPFHIWSSGIIDPTHLIVDTNKRSLTLSEGNAGHVWRSKIPLWSTDLKRDMCIPRSLDAVEAGLEGGIWFAIKTESTVYGVIEILGRNFPKSNREVLLAIESLGMKIGKFISEKHV